MSLPGVDKVRRWSRRYPDVAETSRLRLSLGRQVARFERDRQGRNRQGTLTGTHRSRFWSFGHPIMAMKGDEASSGSEDSRGRSCRFFTSQGGFLICRDLSVSSGRDMTLPRLSRVWRDLGCPPKYYVHFDDFASRGTKIRIE